MSGITRHSGKQLNERARAFTDYLKKEDLQLQLQALSKSTSKTPVSSQIYSASSPAATTSEDWAESAHDIDVKMPKDRPSI
ncbi:hypothetical protein B0O80DRAFT_503322 [Mortierella sp. GBAus27b]|nr:hypothetical protein B0O80DRAFT_503322 [Mortierella sp. GBAus27b]